MALLSSPGTGERALGSGAGRRSTSTSSSSGDIVLEVAVPKHLDSSLIDLDVHPHYVSIVIKGKVMTLVNEGTSCTRTILRDYS